MLKKILVFFVAVLLLASTAIGVWYWVESNKYPKPEWTAKELGILTTLWIGNLPPLTEDPSNRVANNPAAAKLGHQLFFDKRFSSNGQVACATCHKPELHFTDGQALATGVGITGRSSPSIVGTAYHPFIFWDGRADSQWAQALGPMESAVEHGGSRMQYAHIIANDKNYKQQYETLFGTFPELSDENRFPPRAGPVDKRASPEVAAAWDNMTGDDKKTVSVIYSNIGKSIAAYERVINPAPARFDEYADAVLNKNESGMGIFNRDEVEGLRLFIGKARCNECHNGPLFSNDGFQNIGTPTAKGKSFDFGRSKGVHQVVKSEFNCMSEYSDAEPMDCGEIRFIKRRGDDLMGSFKVPGLRNVTKTAPYMHAGELKDLDEVMKHYNDAPLPLFGHSMLSKLELDPTQLEQLKQFLHTLDSSITADQQWLQAPNKL